MIIENLKTDLQQSFGKVKNNFPTFQQSLFLYKYILFVLNKKHKTLKPRIY